jgi:hypothetical protein
MTEPGEVDYQAGDRHMAASANQRRTRIEI